MIYGILLESCRDGVCETYGPATWKRIVQDLNFEHESFTTLGRYEANIIERVAECLAEVLHEGTPDLYMQFFGECFVRFFTNYGYDKILRVAGRHFRDFLLSIDQLHDSNRFSFPKMKSPLFHVTDEDENGAVLHYKSKRRGFQRYIIGQLKECAARFFKEEISIRIQDDVSSNEYTHIVFRVDFHNYQMKTIGKRFIQNPTLPDVTSATFFKVFPFAIILDPQMRIFHIGDSVKNVFPPKTQLIGRHLDDVFCLLRPDILLEWNRVLSYGRHIVFVIESRIALQPASSIIVKQLGTAHATSHLRLKGQMKLISAWNMIAFLCHPELTTAEEMLSVGLFLHDINFYDGSSEILIAGMQHARTLQAAIDKQQAWITKLQGSKHELMEWRRKGKRLLYNIMPRHIAQMLQEGVLANSICESHKLITVLFAYSIDFKDVVQKLAPQQIVESINAIVNAFDQCSEHFDVFKVETKADSSYMVVSGIQDRGPTNQRRASTASGSSITSVAFSEELNGDLKNPLGLNQAEVIAGLALEMLASSKKVINPVTGQPFRLKTGFHSGSAVGGIVGAKNVQYCLFGDTVNTASRITTTGEPGRIHISDTAYLLLKGSPYFEVENKGPTELKGKGIVETYWLVGPKSTYTTAIELDPLLLVEERHSVSGHSHHHHGSPRHHHTGSHDSHNRNVADGRGSQASQRLSTTINKASHPTGGCPFSGH
ncbi:unnamed protein product [Adineta ricciae]|uniref:guanylate cyclase n=1 Tax=Adineta ricciae TaxID=249248 RepID=A0A814UIF2_ADIRI|nr:unnamed protein product [Adineta ricciae]CAF1640939.1 unnamed protein product [Adineta ricciae]